ncbi:MULTISPECIES: Ger(x)C family spore germination protein [Paenibacillus]|uniref:Ger(X)C family spore germination protein n=1 Tax=Paenibacillus violae TaxID=3077234 RepID=A0ABU3R986_9BACL|nr:MULTISPECIES: Ger(x)C family spore germination protein [Paenibacillus]MDU0200834.1 Ger(x)C family spore germination protein [Paenibacillus sp. PFR10]MEC0268332.1 Ger(x)C family spore germination protein [Paenibacillus anseongense]
MSKRLMNSLLLLILILPITGCWDRTELNDLAIITAMAIDSEEDKQVRITIQFIIPQNLAGGILTSGGGGRRTTIRMAKGIDIANTLANLQQILPRKLFWGQCKVIIFSDSLAKAGLKEHSDYLVRQPQIRERAYVFVAKGKASEALRMIPPLERSSSEVIRELAKMPISYAVTVEQLSIMLKSRSKAVALPLVYILPPVDPKEPTQTIPYIKGTAIFKNSKMIGEISEIETRGLLWIKNLIEKYTITFKLQNTDALISLTPVKAQVKLLPSLKNGKWKMTMKVKTSGDIVQNGSKLNPLEPAILEELNHRFEEEVKDRIESSVQDVQKRFKTDIFDFANVFYRKYPKQWEEVKEEWDEMFAHIEVNAVVDAHINRPGLVNWPGGLTKEEVQKQ